MIIGRTASSCGVIVFYRKFIAYVLLVLYGVPATIGPHWQDHQGCDDGLACTSSLKCNGQTSSSVSPPAKAHCCCHRAHRDSICDSVANTAELPVLAGEDADYGSCAICHFYSCMPIVGLALSTHVQGSLVELLAVAQYEQLPTVYHIHLAPARPRGESSLSLTCPCGRLRIYERRERVSEAQPTAHSQRVR